MTVRLDIIYMTVRLDIIKGAPFPEHFNAFFMSLFAATVFLFLARSVDAKSS